MFEKRAILAILPYAINDIYTVFYWINSLVYDSIEDYMRDAVNIKEAKTDF